MKMQRAVSLAAAMAVLLFSLVSVPNSAEAKHRGPHRGHHGRAYGYYDHRQNRWVDYQTGKIIKGGLVGAGIGAGAGLLLDRNVGKSALVGAGIGAGTQAVRYSRTMQRHPIAKTAAYGALAGTGVSAATGKRLGKGALVGGALGAGFGALEHF